MTKKSKPEDSGCRATPTDGHQSVAAAEIARGTVRFLTCLDYVCVAEMPLPNGQRAGIVALSQTGKIVIVEIKSCHEDFRAGQKWSGYRDYCDALYFAVNTGFPLAVLPPDTGLIVADRYGADMISPAPDAPLQAARRKAVTLLFARASARRLSNLLDPELLRLANAGV